MNLDWDTLQETITWVGIALLAGGCLVVWGSLALMQWSRPKTRRWNGKEIV